MIKQIRNSLKLTQAEFANILGMTQANLSRLETGYHKPTPEVAIKIENLSEGAVHRSMLRPDIFESRSPRDN